MGDRDQGWVGRVVPDAGNEVVRAGERWRNAVSLSGGGGLGRGGGEAVRVGEVGKVQRVRRGVVLSSARGGNRGGGVQNAVGGGGSGASWWLLQFSVG